MLATVLPAVSDAIFRKLTITGWLAAIIKPLSFSIRFIACFGEEAIARVKRHDTGLFSVTVKVVIKVPSLLLISTVTVVPGSTVPITISFASFQYCQGAGAI